MNWIAPQTEQLEQEAAKLNATLLKGEFIRRDGPGAPEQTHDFDVVLGDQTVVALEVTSSVIGEVAAFWTETSRRQLKTSGLAHDWSVRVDKVKRLQRELVPLLKSLEAQMGSGVVDVMCARDEEPAGVAQLRDALRSLRVQSANPLPRAFKGSPQVVIGTSGFYRHVPLNELVENCVKDNLDKLKAASGDQKHLFIWITNSDTGNAQRMALEQLPEDSPVLDPAITVVWVALWSPNYATGSNAIRLWSVNGVVWRSWTHSCC